MHGQGLTPQAYHPVADKLTDAELQRLLRGIEQDQDRRLAAYPSHWHFIGDYCRA